MIKYDLRLKTESRSQHHDLPNVQNRKVVSSSSNYPMVMDSKTSLGGQQQRQLPWPAAPVGGVFAICRRLSSQLAGAAATLMHQ